ncbi:MAG: methyltransferase domain-containing protein [Candidatus Lokiarchaeota archaeon]|nr:methyltransferase domain-containing protein [Candidatus Lokiarchaeota archaeon]
MTDYAFILGKNWLLSLAELILYLQDRDLIVKVRDHSRNVAIIEMNQRLDLEQIVEIQSALGGCFKLGEVITTYEKDLVTDAFPRKGKPDKSARKTMQRCDWTEKIWKNRRYNKVKFGVSTYPMIDRKPDVDLRKFTYGLNQWIKNKLLADGIRKASFFIYDEPDRRDKRRASVALWPHTIARHGLLVPPNAEILATFTDSKLYLSKTVVVYDSQLQKYRDESRPYVSAEISTSPKICRTLLNFAGARPGETVLDPFCGTGTLLMEAIMLGIRAIGIDVDPDVLQGAHQNIMWLSRDLGEHVDFELIRGDSRQVVDILHEPVDSVAFEPHLGPVLEEKPDAKTADEIIEDLTELYNTVLRGLSEVLKPRGRVGMTLPLIKSTKDIHSIDISRILLGTDFEIGLLLPDSMLDKSLARDSRIVINPNRDRLPERKMGQLVQRELIMLIKV